MKSAIRKIQIVCANEVGFGLVEALVAAIILAFGVLAVAGLTASTAGHERLARWQTHQALAAQLALAAAYKQHFDSVTSGTDTITVGGHPYPIKTSVSELSSRVKEVSVEVAAVGPLNVRTFTTRLYAPRPLPGPVP